MADLLGFLSALVVVGCILLVAGLITRFGVAPREAILHRDHFVRQGIPSQAMIGVKNPFSLEVKSIRSCPEIEKKGDILLLLNNEVPCRVTLYWEVNKDSLTAAISQDESETASSFDHHSEINDPELRELPSMSTIPLEHILDGCYEDRDPSEFYDSAPDHEIVAKLPPNMEANLETKSSLVSYTSSKHSLVITVEMSGKDEMCPQQLSEIVALITAVQVSKSKTSQPVCSITMQCVQTAEGKLYSLKKLFVVESDNPLETETALRSPSSSSPTDGNLNTRSSDPMNTMCIVCSALPVSRAFLPCRHACVCGLCFSHLNCCPMCRGLIHSYFKVQEEPYIKNAEFDSSTELNNMSVGELLRGVWSAS